jgi:hypothetical protein
MKTGKKVYVLCAYVARYSTVFFDDYDAVQQLNLSFLLSRVERGGKQWRMKKC